MEQNPDAALSVRFFIKPVRNDSLSKEEGRPIFEDVEMVSIMAPGNRLAERHAQAHEVHYDANIKAQRTYAERFSGQYEQFQQGRAEQITGTPIEMLTSLTASDVAGLHERKIRTVEQLAGMADRTIGKMGQGFRAYVDAAKAFLDASSGGNAAAERMASLEAENVRIQAKLDELLNQSREPKPEIGSEFDGYEVDDLKNMILDAGGAVPRGNAKRETLIAKLREIAEQEAA